MDFTMTPTDTLYNPDDTICAISTPPGAGGIAVVRLSGPKALVIADKIWHGKKLADVPSHTVHLGDIVDTDNNILDQAVATVFRAPGSYTGDDTVEFAVHGSIWIQHQLLDILCSRGARLAAPGEYTQRAFAAGHLDLVQAEAVADLIAASSKAAHRLALAQMRGNISTDIEKLRKKLIHLASLLELELDFAEEDVEFASRTQIKSLAIDLRDSIKRMLASFKSGQAIKNGIPVAIVGAPNAGKSSLLNILVDDERAIVSDIAGTTRDTIEDTANLGQYLIRFIDTAGICKTNDKIEAIGVERAKKAAQKAMIVLNVTDAANPVLIPGPADDSILTINVLNKTDITEQIPDGLSDPVLISTRTKRGIDNLKTAIIKHIETLNPAGEQLITNVRHAHALQDAADAADATILAIDNQLPTDLIAEELRQTLRHLASITGEITTPTLLQTIFSSFCIGK